MEKTHATLSEGIYEELYQDILSQKLRCGQKLTLKTLKERFGVSHTPIREALTRLAENGLMDYHSNSGVTVLTFSDDEIKQIYYFIGELDALAIRFCKFEYNHLPLVFEAEEIIRLGDEFLAKDDIENWKKCSEDFHVVFYKHAQNKYLTQAAERLYSKLTILSNMYYTPDNIPQINEAHCRILEQIKNNDFDLAADLMKEHLQNDLLYALKAYHEFLK